MSSYMSRLLPRSNSSLFLCSGKALQSEVFRLGKDMIMVDAGLGNPRNCSQNEATGVPINRATSKFENKVGFLDRVAGESPIRKKMLERWFIDVLAGEPEVKERAVTRFSEMVGSTDVVPGEPHLLLPRRYRENRADLRASRLPQGRIFGHNRQRESQYSRQQGRNSQRPVEVNHRWEEAIGKWLNADIGQNLNPNRQNQYNGNILLGRR